MIRAIEALRYASHDHRDALSTASIIAAAVGTIVPIEMEQRAADPRQKFRAKLPIP
jgi:hypothetical protein